MRRRELIFLVGGAAIWQLPARGQQQTMPVIGYLGNASPDPNAPFATGFHQGLSDAGCVEGENLAIEYRWAEGRHDREPRRGDQSSFIS